MQNDQPKNRFLVKKMLKIVLIVREWEKREELVSVFTIENLVRKLMTTEEREMATEERDGPSRVVMDG